MNVFVCGGGTGGHFFSGVAIAEEFLLRNPQAEIVFVGTRSGIEARAKLDDPRMRKLFIPARGFKRRGLQAQIIAALYLLGGLAMSAFFLIRERPKLVIGVGGYASFPTVFAATLLRWLFKWKVVVVDQNSSPGLANKVLSKMPLLAFCGFPAKGFQLINLPIRQKFKEIAAQAESFRWPPERILIVGGSQGARGLNQRWRLILPFLKDSGLRVRIVHQTGAADEASMREIYQDLGFEAEVFAFSDRLQDYFARADMLICRSGAMTVFEALAFQRPCVFIPFPGASDDHQRLNALSVQQSSWVVAESEFTWARFEPLLRSTQPAIPSRKADSVVSWDEIFRL